MPIFLDFEASSLTESSFPIEIAWVFEDGRSRTFLIRPAPRWTGWSRKSEAIHGISRQTLMAEGTEISEIVNEMIGTLSGKDLVASAPWWDGKWLGDLLQAAGLPRHSLQIRETDEAFEDAARTALGSAATGDALISLVDDIDTGSEPKRPAHRALPDALVDWQRWIRIAQYPKEEARKQPGSAQ
ncbi:3'-5' exonuclease [Rhizobium leguminosarum]|uniref:3'-5' exonuclease n=1 Tax=Rhizobium leguminosarum TaxID=384 RepID=UPI001031E82D|nr:transcriptional regulator [Rhizobium leguminosarum]TAV52920.1 transcriptional regulator [Rhizobium leguminosarum]